jgi:hypothetical protein
MTNSVNCSNDGVVVLRGTPVPLKSDVGGAFVSDCSRNWEKLLSNNQICEKYGLTTEAWQQLGANNALVLAVRAEHERRIRNGTAAQEAAAKQFATAPTILGDIMRNEDASPRHRIEAARELRQTAIGTGSENTRSDSAERFTITINLGADEKIVVDAGKIAPHAPLNWEGSDVAEG